MKKTGLLLSLLALAVLLAAAPAFADTLNLTLTSPVQTGTANGTLTFDATVSAPLANSGTVYLNGDDFNLTLAGATIDDTDFLLNFPLSLNPGETFTGTLFTVTLPSVLSAGANDGFFEILGGSDSAAQDTLATATFEIDGAAPVPEPGTGLLLLTGIAAPLVSRLRRYYRQAN